MVLKRFLLFFLPVALVGISLFIYAFFIEPDRLILKEKEIRIAGWNKAFDGLRIVVISDIHGGSSFITEDKLKSVVEMANSQSPDLIVLLGDFVSQRYENKPISERGLKMPMETVARNLRGLKAAHGVFAVLGNHDGWYNDEIVSRELTLVGIRVLESEIAEVSTGENKIRLLGLPDHRKINDWSTVSEQVQTALKSENGTGDVIVLEHSPDIVPLLQGDSVVSKDVKLFLAGHTHGGQVWFPFLGSLIVPSDYGQKYAFGHIVENGLDIFVTTGVGTSILPVRFLVPPEVVVLTIRSE